MLYVKVIGLGCLFIFSNSSLVSCMKSMYLYRIPPFASWIHPFLNLISSLSSSSSSLPTESSWCYSCAHGCRVSLPGAGQPIVSHTAEENSLFLPQRPSTANHPSSAGWDYWVPSTSILGRASLSYPGPVRSATSAVSSWVQLLCHIQKLRLQSNFYCHVAFTISLVLLPPRPLGLGDGKI